MKCKVRQLILKPLLEKSTLSTHRKVQNFQVQVQKLQMQRVESSKVKILRSRKVLPSQICLCYSLISISSFSIVKLLHCRSGRVAYNVLQLQEVGGFLPRFFCGEEFLIYHKFFCGAGSRQFLVGAVTGWAIGAQSFLYQLYFLVGL